MTIADRIEDLRQERSERRVVARDLFASLVREDFYATNPRTLEAVIRAAKREEYAYAHYLGEPIPEHVRQALSAEVLSWIDLYGRLTGAPMPESEYAVLCAELRPRVVDLIDLLSVEVEMLTNPLVRYYEAWVRSYRNRSR